MRAWSVQTLTLLVVLQSTAHRAATTIADGHEFVLGPGRRYRSPGTGLLRATSAPNTAARSPGPEGMRFETCWSTPLCTPTRTMVMTGRAVCLSHRLFSENSSLPPFFQIRQTTKNQTQNRYFGKKKGKRMGGEEKERSENSCQRITASLMTIVRVVGRAACDQQVQNAYLPGQAIEPRCLVQPCAVAAQFLGSDIVGRTRTIPVAGRPNCTWLRGVLQQTTSNVQKVSLHTPRSHAPTPLVSIPRHSARNGQNTQNSE